MSTTASLCCVICAECYKSTDEILSTSCGHVFHKLCFEDWQMRSLTCPDCRLNLPQTQRIYLHFEEHADLEHKFMQTKLELSNKISILEQQLQESEIDLFDTLNIVSAKDEQIRKLLNDLELSKAENESYKEELEAKEERIRKILKDFDTPEAQNENYKGELEAYRENENTEAIKKEFCDNLKESDIIQNEENIESKIEKPYTGAIKKQFFGTLRDKVIDTNFDLSKLQISPEEPKHNISDKTSKVFPFNIEANPFLCTPPQGASTSSASNHIDLTTRKKSIFASRFAADTTEKCIKYYIKEQIPDLDDIAVQKFNTPPYRRVCSFRITVPENFYDEVLQSSFWPSFVYVNEFIERNNVATVPVLEKIDSPQIETGTN